MKLFNLKNEPVFLRESNLMETQVNALKKLKPNLNKKGQSLLSHDVSLLEYGIAGEKNIEFELKNSHMPIYVLHDVHLKHGDLSAQIDYLIFTKKMCFVIECKNLYGNLQVDNKGNFTRVTEYKGRKKREGIYSPITQNQRHLDIIKKIIVDQKSNALMKFIVGRSFEDYYKSVVVLANPKTVLQTRYATKEVTEKVIRADQLVNYLRKTYNESKELPNSNKQTRTWAETFLHWHQETKYDYTQRYESYRRSLNTVESNRQSESHFSVNKERVSSIPLEETDLYKALKKFRLKESRIRNIPAYFIFNDEQLKTLIRVQPKTKEELQMVKGFGAIKVEQYGDNILKMIDEHTNE